MPFNKETKPNQTKPSLFRVLLLLISCEVEMILFRIEHRYCDFKISEPRLHWLKESYPVEIDAFDSQKMPPPRCKTDGCDISYIFNL